MFYKVSLSSERKQERKGKECLLTFQALKSCHDVYINFFLFKFLGVFLMKSRESIYITHGSTQILQSSATFC